MWETKRRSDGSTRAPTATGINNQKSLPDITMVPSGVVSCETRSSILSRLREADCSAIAKRWCGYMAVVLGLVKLRVVCRTRVVARPENTGRVLIVGFPVREGLLRRLWTHETAQTAAAACP
mmetsp:Transcript_29714/g.59010  ORF Transcript_29714/g.59010 Transcript_29714/m.59010 type:complete len:122 (+) Transcript_29714:92-457(+)